MTSMKKIRFVNDNVEVTTEADFPFVGKREVKEVLPYTTFSQGLQLTGTYWVRPVIEGIILKGIEFEEVIPNPRTSEIGVSQPSLVTWKRPKLPDDAKSIGRVVSKMGLLFDAYENNANYYLIGSRQQYYSMRKDVYKDYLTKIPQRGTFNERRMVEIIGREGTVTWTFINMAVLFGAMKRNEMGELYNPTAKID